MRLSTVLTLLAFIVVRSAAAALPLVTICTDGMFPNPVVALATFEATEIFATIGVKTQWRTLGCPSQAIRVTLIDKTPPDLRPGTLGYALPYEGTHIEVFYDRIAASRRGMSHQVLAYVLVHEIGHILQGIARHSEEGVMKANWSEEDYKLMFRTRMKFMQVDIDLIHDGLKYRAGRTLVTSSKRY